MVLWSVCRHAHKSTITHGIDKIQFFIFLPFSFPSDCWIMYLIACSMSRINKEPYNKGRRRNKREKKAFPSQRSSTNLCLCMLADLLLGIGRFCAQIYWLLCAEMEHIYRCGLWESINRCQHIMSNQKNIYCTHRIYS